MNSISFIIPSINRPSLHDTIASIEVWEEDEVLVEFDLPPSGRWGNDQRNAAMLKVKSDYIAFIDDDDVYLPGHRWIMETAIREQPDHLHLFKMEYPNGKTLWETPELKPGNVGSPMILAPFKPKQLYHWKDGRNMADFIFVDKWKGEITWHDKVVALLGHNDGERDV